MTLSLEINQILATKGVHVKREWIEAAVEYIQGQTVGRNQTAAILADKVCLLCHFPYDVHLI